MQLTRIDQEQRNTDAELEWRQIAMQRESDILERGPKWLIKYANLPIASECLQRLLEIKPTARLKRRALNWLRKFPEGKSSLRLTAALLELEPSKELLLLAKKQVLTARYWFEACEPEQETDFGLASLMRQILKAHPRSRLCDQIEDYVVKYPANYIWTWVIPGSNRSDARNRRLEKLTIRWVDLNVGNPDLFLLSLPSRIPTVEIIESCFNWVLHGGRKNNFMPALLADLLRNAKVYKALLSKIAKFSRKWVESNPNHDDAGRVYGALLYATEVTSDINGAKAWYKKHLKNKTSSYVVITSLEHSFWTSTKPDSYIVKRARILMRAVERRTPRLIGALVSVAPDSEVIALAKDICKRQKPMWILTRVLLIAPDAELITIAREEYNRYRGASLEPDLLYSLLKVDPNDSVTRRRARLWMRQNAKHGYYPFIKELLKKL